MDYYKGKICVVTGGASGLGRALCLALGARGAQVVLVDINLEEAKEVADLIKSAGGKAIFAYLDVKIYKNAQRIVQDVIDKYGRIDLIINNAGTAIQGETRDLSVDQWENVINVNLMGVIYGAISAYSVMEIQKHGQIVNIGSLAGLIPVPKEIPYCTSKWAVVGFSHSLRVEGRDLGVKVNLVCPGIMHTPIHDTMSWVQVDKEKQAQTKLIKYFMSPEQAAIKILKGVEQNKEVIVFPFYARLCWWIYRLTPFLFQFVFNKIIRDFRKTRIEK